MTRLLVLSTILVLFWPGAALAEPAPTRDDAFDRNGFYLGVGFVQAVYTEVEDDLEKELESLAGLGYIPPVVLEAPPGLDARVGYRFHPRLAAEVEIQWFAKAGIQFTEDEGDPPPLDPTLVEALTLETVTLTVNSKAYLLTGRFQPFLLVGAGFMHFDAKDALGLGLSVDGDGFAARFGGGLDFYLTPNVVIALDGSYVLPTGDADGLNYVSWSLGLQYRF